MDGYDYDDRRMRRLLVGAAVLGGLVLLAAGFGIGRVSSPASGAAQRGTAASQAGPGPTRMVNGVPLGYAHTEAGAVAAATNFLMVVDGPLITQPDKYRSAIDTLAAPEAREKQRSDAEKNMNALQAGERLISYAQQGRTVIFRLTPLAYHVDRYGGGGAQVSIWAEGFVAIDGVLSMRETWTTSKVTVAWVGDDWRLSEIGGPTPDSFGPAPTTAQPSVQSAKLPPQLSNYRSYHVDVG